MDAANFGIGFDHNSLTMLGIVGGFLILAIIWMVFSSNWRLYRFARASAATLLFGFAFVVFSVITGHFATSVFAALVVAAIVGRYAQRRFWA